MLLRAVRWLGLPGLALLLSACASGGGGAYVGGDVGLECAPFARALTGVQLTGAAYSWWEEASGRYQRSSQPSQGSVLVLRQDSRLPYGHVAVVSRVLSERQIMVTQANWVHHRVTEDQPVVDVSTDNDWTEVRCGGRLPGRWAATNTRAMASSGPSARCRMTKSRRVRRGRSVSRPGADAWTARARVA
jgi:surface antigen